MRTMGAILPGLKVAGNVAYWPKADMTVRDSDVRFRGVERTSTRARGLSAIDAVDGAHSAASKCHRVVA